MNTPEPAPPVWINGTVVPADKAFVPVSDRGFLLGDSMYEAVLVRSGNPFRWDGHVARLLAGAAFTRIAPPARATLDGALEALVRAAGDDGHGTVRVTLSRGPGPRGFSPRHAGPPTLVLAWHPAGPVPHAVPAARTLVTAPLRVPAGDPLAGHKHGSRLANVLARAAADDAGADEAVMLDTDGRVAETSAGNLFLVRGGRLVTPPAAGLLPGVTRACVLALAPGAGLEPAEEPVFPADLRSADAVFFTSTTIGIAPVASFDGQPAGDPTRCHALAAALDALVRAECRSGRGF